MVDEGSIIALVAADDPTLVPEVLASDAATRTVLLAHVPGEDQYDATEDRLIEMVRRLVALQTRWVDRSMSFSKPASGMRARSPCPLASARSSPDRTCGRA